MVGFKEGWMQTNPSWLCNSGSFCYARTSGIALSMGTHWQLYEDNGACITMANAQKPTSCTRRMDIKYHILCEWVEHNLLFLSRVDTSVNMSDHFTKQLGPTLFHHMLTISWDGSHRIIHNGFVNSLVQPLMLFLLHLNRWPTANHCCCSMLICLLVPSSSQCILKYMLMTSTIQIIYIIELWGV
jgi:hypothetical protein